MSLPLFSASLSFFIQELLPSLERGASLDSKHSREEQGHPRLTLGPREAVGRPTKRVPICAHESIFLLHSKPRVLVAHHVHYPFTGVS
jgi:hypothetical protein